MSPASDTAFIHQPSLIFTIKHQFECPLKKGMFVVGSFQLLRGFPFITVVNEFVVCILQGVAESKNNILVYNVSLNNKINILDFEDQKYILRGQFVCMALYMY